MITRNLFVLQTLLFTAIASTSSAFMASPTSTTVRPLARRTQESSIELGMADFSLDPEKTAILLIEYQNEFTTEGGKLHEAVKESMAATNMLENSSNLMNAARQAGCSIIHCPISFEKGHNELSNKPYGVLAGVKEGEAFTQNEWGADFCPQMRPQPTDKVVKGKSGLCGFYSTNLDFLLRQADIKNVVIGGFLTNCCVESSMRTAYEHGYQVYTLEDCCAATSVEAHDNAFKNDFGMFSVPTKSTEVIGAIQSPVV